MQLAGNGQLITSGNESPVHKKEKSRRSLEGDNNKTQQEAVNKSHPLGHNHETAIYIVNGTKGSSGHNHETVSKTTLETARWKVRKQPKSHMLEILLISQLF